MRQHSIFLFVLYNVSFFAGEQIQDRAEIAYTRLPHGSIVQQQEVEITGLEPCIRNPRKMATTIACAVGLIVVFSIVLCLKESCIGFWQGIR